MSTDVRIPWLIFVYLLIGVFAAGYGVGANTYEPVSSIPRDVPPSACLCEWDCYCYCCGECGGKCNCCGVGPVAARIQPQARDE